LREVSSNDYSLCDAAAKFGREERELAPYAQRSERSRGRSHAEPEDVLRTPWERDRDRIVHSTSFRRLMYKTQVFANWEGDHYRTRLSHTLEVAQVARSVASALRLNETLTEAMSLAHDIGHPPFGHRGEQALNSLMKDRGGFRHNAQALRALDLLERRDPRYPGLNLTHEVRVALLKHEQASDWPAEFGPRPRRPSLEAQVVDLADSTAYHNHDLQDGLLAGMFGEDQLDGEVELWRDARAAVEKRFPGAPRTSDRNLHVQRITGELIKICIGDLIRASAARLAQAAPADAASAQELDRLLIGHSEELAGKIADLTRFLYARFYRHPHLLELSDHAERSLRTLFAGYLARPEEMAPWYQRWVHHAGIERAVCDYIAGMTDRFAQTEYTRQTGG
jgi:dGTPase